MITIRGISKHYGAITALTDVNLEVASGECVALTGSSGSGRTTMLRILATLTRPSSGQVTVDNLDAFENVQLVRSKLAYVAEEPVECGPIESMGVGEFLDFMRRARTTGRSRKPITPLRDVVERAGLSENERLGTLSTTMRRRLSLAAALSCGAEILLLDEPLQSLDAESHARFLEWLQEVRAGGATIVAAINERRDVDAICQRTVALEAGRIMSRAA